MKLYSHPFSPASQKVRLVLAEKELSWELQHVDLPNKENLEPWYRELNSLGMLPTLVDNGAPINESSVICEYLEDTYPEKSLRPDDLVQRAKMRWWMSVVDDRLHYATGALVWPILMRPALLEKSDEEREVILSRIPDRARQARHRRWVEYGVDNPDFDLAVLTFCDAIKDMAHCLADHEWLAGDQISLADCTLLPYIQALSQMGWDGIYESHPVVADWFNRGRARTSFKEQIEAQLPAVALTQIRGVGDQFKDMVLDRVASAA